MRWGALIVAVTPEVTAPLEFYEQASVLVCDRGPMPVSANVILTEEAAAQAWSRLNPTIPVLVLDGREVRAAVIGGRLVNVVVRLRPGAAAEFVAGLTGALRAVEPGDDGPTLTKREVEVVQQLVAGHSNAAIARNLGIAYGTVKAHVSNLMRKLGARNRIDAVARVVWEGLAGPAAVAPLDAKVAGEPEGTPDHRLPDG